LSGWRDGAISSSSTASGLRTADDDSAMADQRQIMGIMMKRVNERQMAEGDVIITLISAVIFQPRSLTGYLIQIGG
jgi:hypothetical protein